MKSFIIGIGVLFLSIFVYISVQDVNEFERQSKGVRFACEELSVTGTLFNDKEEYSNGRMVFNRTESTKAIEAQLKSLLNTDDMFNPLPDHYWTDKLVYMAYFFDDSNTTYPYLFTDPDTGFTETIVNPTVIITIKAGKGRFRYPGFTPTTSVVRSASHEWKQS